MFGIVVIGTELLDPLRLLGDLVEGHATLVGLIEGIAAAVVVRCLIAAFVLNRANHLYLYLFPDFDSKFEFIKLISLCNWLLFKFNSF